MRITLKVIGKELFNMLDGNKEELHGVCPKLSAQHDQFSGRLSISCPYVQNTCLVFLINRQRC
jgi:hypothetical protein